MNSFLCIDVGGSEIKTLIMHESDPFEPKEMKQWPAKSDASKEEIFLNFSNILNYYTSPNYTISGIGMAFPGPFDYTNGISLISNISKYDSIYGYKIEDEIKAINTNWINDCEFIFLHDIAAFALGCCALNSLLLDKKVMYLCIGTGAGSAFTENGRLIEHGKCIPENGWIYNTKFKDSIIDDYISTRGLAALSQKYLGQVFNGYQLQIMAENDNASALAIFNEFGRNLYESIHTFLEECEIDHLVFGGQISKGFEYFSADLTEYCDKKGISIECIFDTSTVICTGVYSSFLHRRKYGTR